MVRIIGILTGLVFTLAVLISFGVDTYSNLTTEAEETAEHHFHAEPLDVSFPHDGPFGKWDTAQLQRGYVVYKEVCSACHSLKYVAFRDLADLGYTEAEVQALAAEWQVPGIDPRTGETVMRAAEPTDYFPSPYPNDVAAAAANNNAIPPDLSLMTKARHGGAPYVYSLLTGYEDPATYSHDGERLLEAYPDFEVPTGLYFNPYFPNLNLAMAPPLTTTGQVTYEDGTEATIAQMSKDVSAFLSWTAEPTMDDRKQTGWPVLGFVLFATILAYLSKKQIWAAVKPAKRKD